VPYAVEAAQLIERTSLLPLLGARVKDGDEEKFAIGI